MRLVPMRSLLDRAVEKGYAVPAFNVCNMENIQCVLRGAEESRAPVILQAHYLEAQYAGEKTLMDMVRTIGADMDLDVSVHLDHGACFEDTMRCIQGGFTSVMYDGSAHPLAENIEVLKQVVASAHAVGVTVEGEIGTIGQTSEFGERIENAHLTDPSSAEKLVRETGIDCLAVAIGNAHGFYTAKPELNLSLLEEIHERCSIPLVLHGGTGIPKDQIRASISLGIAKINFSTVLRSGYINGMREHMERYPQSLDLMDIMAAGSAKMREAVKRSIELCACKHQAK